MAGRPRERLMVLELEKRCRAYFEDDEHNVLEYIAAWHAGGNTLVKLARELSNALDLELVPEHITRWLYRAFDRGDAVKVLTEAREQGAHVMVAAAIDDAERLTEKDMAPVVRVRNDARHWAAQRYNRRELGESKANVAIQVNIGSLHLDALRSRSVEREAATELGAHAGSVALAVCQSDTPAILPAIDVDYEVANP